MLKLYLLLAWQAAILAVVLVVIGLAIAGATWHPGERWARACAMGVASWCFRDVCKHIRDLAWQVSEARKLGMLVGTVRRIDDGRH